MDSGPVGRTRCRLGSSQCRLDVYPDYRDFVGDFSAAIQRYQARLTQEIEPIIQWIQGFGFQLDNEMLLKSIDPGASMRLVAKMLSGLGSILTNSFLILLTVIFILFEASSFQQKVRIAFGDPKGTLSQAKKNYGCRQQLFSHKNPCQPWDRCGRRDLGLGTGN